MRIYLSIPFGSYLYLLHLLLFRIIRPVPALRFFPDAPPFFFIRSLRYG